VTLGPAWVVVNQSQGPAFQRLLGDLVADLGPCLEYTGAPYRPAPPGLRLVDGPAYDRRGVVRRMASWLRFLLGAAWRLLRTPGRPLLLVTTNPPFLLHLAWLMGKLRRWPYALLVWDLYPDHVVQVGMAGRGSVVVRLWRTLNRRAFRDARIVITLGDSMAEAVGAQLGGDAAKVVVIPSWADVAELRPIPKAENAFARAHGQVEKLTVMYSGNLGATHGVEVIARLADLLRDEPRIHFMVVGSGLGRPVIEAQARELGLPNLTILDFQPAESFPLSQAAADVALVLQAPGTEHLSVPSKTYSCMAAGSALLALTRPGSDLARVVEETGAGAVESPDDATRAADRIRGWLASPTLLASTRAAARRAAETRFSAEVARANFAAALGAAPRTPTAGSVA